MRDPIRDLLSQSQKLTAEAAIWHALVQFGNDVSARISVVPPLASELPPWCAHDLATKGLCFASVGATADSLDSFLRTVGMAPVRFRGFLKRARKLATREDLKRLQKALPAWTPLCGHKRAVITTASRLRKIVDLIERRLFRKLANRDLEEMLYEVFSLCRSLFSFAHAAAANRGDLIHAGKTSPRTLQRNEQWAEWRMAGHSSAKIAQLHKAKTGETVTANAVKLALKRI